jgi:hypothetical protein
MSIKRSIWIVFFSGLSQLCDAACLNPVQLETLQKNELSYMQNRIPPAFAHAVSDQQVTLKITEQQAEPCTAVLVVNVPEAHLKEAQAVLEADPAKNIMLAAQGYAISTTTSLEANFKVVPTSLEIPSAETLQTAALGQLRASVELMYSLITQARANLPDNAQNATPWSSAYQQANTKRCSEKYTLSSGQDMAVACACQANTLAKHVSERQMEYIDYVRSNPYAVATGSSQYFARLESETLLACGLKAKK